MFKLVVLFALVAIAVASSSVVHASLAYSQYAAPVVGVPAAVSYQSRTDVHSKPVIATYAAAPVATYAASPVAVAVAPAAVAYPAPAVAVPAAVSYQSRTDVHSKPVVAAYPAPAVAYHGYHASPVAYAGYGKIAYGHY